MEKVHKYTLTRLTNFIDDAEMLDREISIDGSDIRFIMSFYTKMKQAGFLEIILTRKLQDEANDILSSSRSMQSIDSFVKTVYKHHDSPAKNIEEKNIRLFIFLSIVYYTIPCTENVSSLYMKQIILDAILVTSINKDCDIMREFVLVCLCSRRQLRDGIQNLVASNIEKYDKYIKCTNSDTISAIQELNDNSLTVKESQDIASAMELALDLELIYNDLNMV